jgi:acyl carrier protein
VGRSGASPAARETLDALERAGIQVAVAQADVAQEKQVAEILATIDQRMPPLKGVIHAAGVLDDGILLHLGWERFRSVTAPKVDGAWNLHRLTLSKPLDVFVLFSSVAALLGSPGQGNYAAANAFLDALAQYRRSQGRPALSINWGPWTEVGLAAAQANRGERLASRGLESLTPTQGIDLLDRLIRQDVPQAAAMLFQVQQWCQFSPAAAASPFFASLAQEQSSDSTHSRRSKNKESNIRDELLAAPAGRKRQSLLEVYLQRQIGQVLRLTPSRIDLHTPLHTLGMDSLMAVEFRNRLEADLGLPLSATLVWGYPTVVALVPYLADKMGVSLEYPEENHKMSRAESNMPSPSSADLEQLSPDEMKVLLAEELAAVDELLEGGAR